MENSLENSHGTDIPKKSRSLDLKSLYESKVSKEVQNKRLKRKARAEDGDGQKNERRNRKKVSLSNFSSIYSRSRKSLDEVYDAGLGSSGHDSKKALKSESRDKLNSSSEFNEVPLILDENVMHIPKRKRGGFVRRKKSLDGQILKPSGQLDAKAGSLDDKAGIVDQIAKSSVKDSSDQVECCKTNRKLAFKDLKEKEQKELSSAQHLKKEDGQADQLTRENELNPASCLKEEGEHIDHSVVKPVSPSSKKSQKNVRKRKISGSRSKSNSKEGEASISPSTKRRDGFPEDDEENLEENAARMLSSRFDPNCTGFSSNTKGSLPPTNGLSFLLSSGHDNVSRIFKPGLESASVDAAGRVLRPRKQRKEKKSSRKRRHFYEILFGDLDAAWVLNRRIKVFWPLDQIWYYGLVNDYDKERKLHHVKYDDRDEEWIDLQNERFKLLLLPSEVPGREERRKSAVGNDLANEKGRSRSRKGKETDAVILEDDCNTSSYMDSEPIISWLARSTNRNKSSPSHNSKRQKTSSLSSKSGSQANENPANLLVKSSGLAERLADVDGQEKSASETTTCSTTRKLPIVYFRKRFRNIGTEIPHKRETDFASRRTHASLAFSFSNVEIDDVEEPDISPRRSEAHRLLWCVDDAGLLQLAIPLMEVGQLRFELSIPEYSFWNVTSSAETFWLFHLAMLIQHGTLTLLWPKVQLEMLFVDNVVGLRFLLFEGCLMQAVAFIFLVLKLFQSPGKQGRYADFQFPITSIRFKFSCLQDIGKQLVFAFYNFSELKNSKWVHLDRLKKYCLISKQLPLTECTYDNIKKLQNSKTQFRASPFCGRSSSVKGTQKISSLGINLKGAACVNSGHSNLCSNETKRNFPAFAISFTAAPTFFLSLHLKLLMERCVAHLSLQHHDSIEHQENYGRLTVDDMLTDDCANSLSTSSKASDRWNSCPQSDLGTGISDCEDGDGVQSSQYKRSTPVAPTCAGSQDTDKASNDVKRRIRPAGKNISGKTMPLPKVARSDKDSFLNDLSVEIPSFQPLDGELHGPQQSMDVGWNGNAGVIPSPNPTAPRSTWHRNKNNSTSLGLASHGWSDGKSSFINGLGNRTKKPRTQVSYSLPFGGFDYSSKSRNSHPKAIPSKRIRRASEKRSDVARGSKRNLELLSCDANVLITLGDRGWRECGARVVLEVFDHNEWKLAVKLSGITKYSYKAHQFLQPGSTNRYTHAMMWKGGKDWILEFPDRSQWAIFKELHEECYNRNIRAASVKNIPIPGVCLLEENDEYVAEIAYMRNPSKYFRQVETDVEMALNPARVLYDMDSDDEQWIKDIRTSSEVGSNSGLGEVSSEVFEKTVDAFEKAAYSQQRVEFTDDEIAEVMNETLLSGLTKAIFEYWQQKRRRKGMPLIRHLQPPLWETYQQQLKDWECTINKSNTSFCNGYHEKAASVEKPPMFAFCLKPRGLEVFNKGSKQRSHRKFSVSGHSNSIAYDHEGLHGFGRRLNGFSLGDDKMAYIGHNYEFLEDSPLIHTSSSLFSPRLEGGILSNDGLERNFLPKLHKSKSRKYGAWASPYDSGMASFNQRMIGKRDGLNRWNNGYSEWSSPRRYPFDGSQRQILEQLEGSDVDEFRLRDASGAAQHARNMAKLKREKARRLLYRADLAIHKAVVAIMTAEAMKAASEDDSNGDG
ncbi:Enhancer of polycomb-like transcription factor protein, putative isoform 1 [Cucumis melo var. makuwa]|uniref:Enhancer of polycomb-like protein n=1 Tax=Cucumis melo var. makuwa TaxID=1194695 RepID=A0A5A7TBM8_CUCMM|nr:Enhancer of polycomb-like transcription factor protein, putative isoform 1 [Cucumis melo var. makuwa]